MLLITHLLTIDPNFLGHSSRQGATYSHWGIFCGLGWWKPLEHGPNNCIDNVGPKAILLQGWNGTPINGRKSMGFIGVITPICRSYEFISYEPVHNRFFGPCCRFLCFRFKPTLSLNTVPPSTNRSNHVRSWKRWIWRPAWHVFNFAWMWWRHLLMRTGGEHSLKLTASLLPAKMVRDDPFHLGGKA